MVNGKLFVLLCTLTTFSSFAFSCYLMSNINPPPLEEAAKIGREAAIPADTVGLSDANETNARRQESLLPFYRFAVDKLLTESREKGSDKKSETDTIPMTIVRNVIPPLNLPGVYRPPKTDRKSTKITEAEKFILKSNITVKTFMRNSDPKSSPLPPIKGHRRSIDSFENTDQEKPGCIILEIIDNDNRPRIEIKINTKDILSNDKNTTKEGSNLIFKVQRNDDEDKVLLDYKTKIKILPNDTVVIENNNKTTGKKTAATYNFIKRDTFIETGTLSEDYLTVGFNNTSIDNLKNERKQKNDIYTTTTQSNTHDKEQQNTLNNSDKETNMLKMNVTKMLNIVNKENKIKITPEYKHNDLKNTTTKEDVKNKMSTDINKKLNITTETNRTGLTLNVTRINNTKVVKETEERKIRSGIYEDKTEKVKVFFSPAKEFNSDIVTRQAKKLLKSIYKSSTTPYNQNISLNPKQYNMPNNSITVIKVPLSYSKTTENSKSTLNIVTIDKNENFNFQNNTSMNYWKKESAEKSKKILKIDEFLENRIAAALKNATIKNNSFIDINTATTEKTKQFELKNLNETVDVPKKSEMVKDTLEQNLKDGIKNLAAVKLVNNQTSYNITTQHNETSSDVTKVILQEVMSTVNNSNVLKKGLFVTDNYTTSLINKTMFYVGNATGIVVTETITERSNSS